MEHKKHRHVTNARVCIYKTIKNYREEYAISFRGRTREQIVKSGIFSHFIHPLRRNVELCCRGDEGGWHFSAEMVSFCSPVLCVLNVKWMYLNADMYTKANGVLGPAWWYSPVSDSSWQKIRQVSWASTQVPRQEEAYGEEFGEQYLQAASLGEISGWSLYLVCLS